MRPVGVLRRSAHAAACKQLLSGQPVGVVRGQEHGDRRDVVRLTDATQRRLCHGAGLDRKSTRLNSSHSQISYAVFCLKKKNNPTTLCTPTDTNLAARTTS